MLITLIRGLILYITIIIFMRFMGKRQLGELQPTEFVITILLSEIASVPMENNENSLLNTFFAISLLVCLEIINSVVNIKFPRVSYLLQGKPAYIIENGIINQKKLKDLRFTADDILEQLRQKDVFDINQVSYAIVETNGSLSVKKKNAYEPVTSYQIGINNKDSVIPTLVINDSYFINASLEKLNMSMKEIEMILKKEKTKIDDILILLVSDKNNYTLIKKDKS